MHRHFLYARNMNIIDDAEFSSAKIVFYKMLKLIKTGGKGDTEPEMEPEMEPEDVRKLYWSFDISNQYGLQEKVWFDIQLYLIRRGRKGLRAMTKTFGVFLDATGRKYFSQITGECEKNHTNKDSTSDSSGEGRLYATHGKTLGCTLVAVVQL